MYLVAGLAILAPPMASLYKRSPLALMIITFIINLLYSYLYKGPFASEIALSGVFAVALGMYLNDHSAKFLLPTTPISAFIAVLYRTWNALTFFYPAIVVVGVISSGIRNRVLELMGRASYHIYLFQMLYFGSHFSVSQHLKGTFIFVGIIIDILIPVFFGIVWYKFDWRVIRQSANSILRV